MSGQLSSVDSRQWETVYNAGSSPVPPFGVMRSTGLDADKVYTIDQPNADSMTEVFVNGDLPIAPGTYGEGTRSDPATVLIETADGTPASGDDYGTQSGSWKAHKGKLGFRCMGSVGDNTIEATFYGSSWKRLYDSVSGLTVQDGLASTSFTSVTIVQLGAEAYLSPFNPFLISEPTAGTARIRLRVADRANAGGVSHDESSLGYQEFGGIKSFCHPLIVGAQNPTGGELGGGQISFLPIDSPEDYYDEGPNGLTNLTDCCIYGGNLSSPQRHLFLYARNLTSDSYDSSASLQVYSGGDIHKPYVEAICVKSDGNTSSFKLNSDGLSVTGSVTINSGALTTALDIGSDRRVTLGVASY